MLNKYKVWFDHSESEGKVEYSIFDTINLVWTLKLKGEKELKLKYFPEEEMFDTMNLN